MSTYTQGLLAVRDAWIIPAAHVGRKIGMSTNKERNFVDYAHIVATMTTHQHFHDNAANAQRLVACWNAFDGVPTEKFAGKSVADYVCEEAYITGMEPVEGAGMELGLKGTALQMFASSFAGQFKANDAINFLEVRMSHPETGPLLVTMQRLEGQSPAQQKITLQLRLDAARNQLDDARALLAELIAIEGPQPGTAEWADKVRAFLKGGA